MMDPRLELYNDIVAALQEAVPEVNHIALWNQDVAFLEEDSEWQRPAVFFEFGDITWTVAKPCNDFMSMRGRGELRVHIVTDFQNGAYEQSFSLGEKVWQELDRLALVSGKPYDVTPPILTQTNHDHEEILDNIEVLGIRLLRTWSKA